MFHTRYWTNRYWTDDYWPDGFADVFPTCIAKDTGTGEAAGAIYQSDVVIGQLAVQNLAVIGQLASQNQQVAGMVFGPADNPDLDPDDLLSNAVVGQLATQNRVIIGMVLCTFYGDEEV